jgi:predicted PurR-regulated permease PerM
MIVILLGAIGGMMLSGIIGLFVGPVVLAFTYKVFEALVFSDDKSQKAENSQTGKGE